MSNETKRIPIIYCRVSSERQKRDGGGLESQEQRCRQYCVQKGYGEPQMVFKDSFTGGGDFMKRPAMKSLLDYVTAKSHENYVVVFDDLKRFARDVVQHWELRKVFKRLDVALESPNFEFKEDDEESWLHEAITATFNEYDRKTNRRQVIQKQRARLLLGYWAFHAPRGYTMTKTDNGKTCVPNERGIILKEGLEGFAYKKYLTLTDLAKFLQDRGFFSKKSHPEKYIDTTKAILLDPFNAGYIEYLPWDVKRFRGKHKPLISDEIFLANVKRLTGEAKSRAPRQDMREEFALRGLVLCCECNYPLAAYFSRNRHGVKYPYYSCQHRGCSLRSKTVPKKEIDDNFKKLASTYSPKKAVLKIVDQMFEDLWKDEMGNVNSGNGKLVSQKIQLEDEVGKLADEIIDIENATVKAQFKKRMSEKCLELEKIDDLLGKKISYAIPYRTSYDQIIGMVKSPYQTWAKGSVAQKHQLFSFMFDSRLVYEYKSGYRTPEKACLYKLFDLIEAGHTVDVEMGGSEPPCNA